jgi:2-succinyl-5-enolpyruvyl-6-hydroxy-3-cyclohexene-1-carboxylate synthase
MEPKNFAHYWCTLMIRRLIKLGIDHFFIGPGSRSTPIVSALVDNKDAKIIIGIDERTVGFSALGFSKCLMKPAAIVVTSGTAVANLYPAVAEAFLSEVPLLLLTADRPFELRDCGANQTMFQANMFAHHVNKSFDIPPPSLAMSQNRSIAIFDQAHYASLWPKKGPVHVNVQLREPLTNIAFPHEPSWQAAKHFSDYQFIVEHKAQKIAEEMIAPIDRFLSQGKGIIAVGELRSSLLQEKVVKLAERIDWPIFADITSNLRLIKHRHLFHHFDLALINPSFNKFFAPEKILKLGGRITSKRFWVWVDGLNQASMLSLNDSHQFIDHLGKFEHHFIDDLDDMVDQLLAKLLPSRTSHTADILKCSDEIGHMVQNFFEEKSSNEAYFAARLISQIPKPSNIFISSSMPIRDLDQFASPVEVKLNVLSNRGVSGIDGVISTAVGVAIADRKPTILLIGDVAFLHDTNGLMLVPFAKAPLLIVVINNSGGGIFHFLPIAEEPNVLSPYLDTPHAVSLDHLCIAHNIEHKKIKEPLDFDSALHSFFKEPRSLVIEISIDKNTNVKLHKEIYRHIAEANLLASSH